MSKTLPNTKIQTGYYKTPNDIVDSYMSKIGPTASSLLQVILRQTQGWNKKEAAISYSVFLKKTGLSSRDTINSAIKKLENHNLISVTREHNQTSIFKYIGDNLDISDELLSEVENHKDISIIKENWTSPNNELVMDSDQSVIRINSSPINEPIQPKSSPITGHIKDKILKTKRTTSSDELKKYMSTIDSMLNFSTKFYEDAVFFLESNNLDFSYCDWLYSSTQKNKNIKSIAGYIYSIFFEENQKEHYLNSKKENIKTVIKKQCPVCDKTSSNELSCTECGMLFEGLTEFKIKRERALFNLSKTQAEEYAGKYEKICKIHSLKPTYSHELALLDSEFGIPSEYLKVAALTNQRSYNE